MNTCPNCGVTNDRDSSVCICGHLLESEDELRRGWETMKEVPVKAGGFNFRRILPHSIWALVALAVAGLALSDSGLRSRLFGGEYTPERRTSETSRPAGRPHQKFMAKVTAVLDGESFTAVDARGNEMQIRLAGVDAPAPGDYFADQSRESLAGAIAGKQVQVEELKDGEQGLVLARVMLDGTNVNLEQLRGGYAFISGNAGELLTSAELESFRQSEVAARSEKLGLWTRGDVVVNSDPAGPSADLTQASASDGVFTFGSNDRQPNPTVRSGDNTAVRTTFVGGPRPVTPGTNPFDGSQPAGNHAFSGGDSKSESDCKPETAAAVLKQPEAVRPPLETKPTVKISEVSKSFTLGPRGGCFYVTASGGKKYVDRSLCGQTAAVAARQ